MKVCTQILNPAQWSGGNGQNIREELLRAAVGKTERYATDILYFIDKIGREVEEGVCFNSHILFFISHIEWSDTDETAERFFEKHKASFTPKSLVGIYYIEYDKKDMVLEDKKILYEEMKKEEALKEVFRKNRY